VLLAYVDESGNTGDIDMRGTLTYTLGCVVINADHWLAAHDEMISFRRRLASAFGLPVRAEVKASYLIRGNGSLTPLGLAPHERFLIYRAHMNQMSRLQARAFAIVVDKRGLANQAQCFDLAWEALLQRLERTYRHPPTSFAIIHDEGEDDAIRKWARRARRYLPAGSAYGTGQLLAAAKHLVDDPIPRHSHQSYMIQLADLVAYAAFRAVIPPSTRVAAVCPATMWDHMGPAILTAVSGLKPRSRPGIVLRN
jgi:hypothetical protein